MVDSSFEEFQAQTNAPRICRPALIVHDLADRELPWEEGERYARFWHDSRLLSTQGLGHNRIVDNPGVIDAAERLLRGSPVGERVVSTPALPYGPACTLPGRPSRPVPAHAHTSAGSRVGQAGVSQGSSGW